jgi:hypothetical protein
MTKINHESPVVRETDSLYKGKPIVIELHGSFIIFRVKGMRSMRAMMSIEGGLQRALQGEASAAASEKITREGKPRKVSRGLIKTGNKGIA